MKYTSKEILLLSAISVAWYLVFAIYSGLMNNYLSDTHVVSDALSYLQSAEKWYHDFQPDDIRPIGFSTIIGFPFLFTDNTQVVIFYALFLQAICWMLTVLFIYRILLLLAVDKRISFFSSLVFLFTLSPLAYSFFLLSETIFIALITGAFYFFIRYLLHKTAADLYTLVALMCVASSVRPLIFYLWILLLAALVLFIYFNKTSLALFCKNLLIIGLIAFSSIGFHMYKMKVAYDTYSLSVTMPKLMWYWAALTRSIEKSTDTAAELEIWMQEIQTESDEIFATYPERKHQPFPQHDIIKKKFIREFTANPFSFIKAFLITLKYNFAGANESLKNHFGNQSFTFMYQLTKYQNILFCSVFMLMLALLFYIFVSDLHWVQSPLGISLLVSAVLASYFLFMGGFFYWQGDRYNVPAFPFVIISSALIIDKWLLVKFYKTNNNK